MCLGGFISTELADEEQIIVFFLNGIFFIVENMV